MPNVGGGNPNVGRSGVRETAFNVGGSGVSLPDVEPTVVFGVTQVSWTGSLQTGATFTDATSFVETTNTSVTKGTLVNVIDNNDLSLTNNSGKTMNVIVLADLQGVGSVAQHRINTVIQTNESGSWANVGTLWGSMTRHNSTTVPETFEAHASLSLSDGKTVRVAQRNVSWTTSTPTFQIATATLKMWGQEA